MFRFSKTSADGEGNVSVAAPRTSGVDRPAELGNHSRHLTSQLHRKCPDGPANKMPADLRRDNRLSQLETHAGEDSGIDVCSRDRLILEVFPCYTRRAQRAALNDCRLLDVRI